MPLEVEFFHIGGGVHDAIPYGTMDEPATMTEFVNRDFSGAFKHERSVGPEAIQLIAETMIRHNCGISSQRCLTEDIGEDGNKEVMARDPDNPHAVRRRETRLPI
jgi:hypothetical protein